MQRSTERQLARIEGRRDDFEAFLDERTKRIPLGRRVDRRRRSPPASSGWRSTRPTTSPPNASTSAAAWTRIEPMARDNQPSETPISLALKLRDKARMLRRHMLSMARGLGAGLYRPGARHRRRAGGALFPRAALRPGRISTGRSATASCSRPATTRSRSGRRSPKPASSRWTSSPPTAPTTAGWR